MSIIAGAGGTATNDQQVVEGEGSKVDQELTRTPTEQGDRSHSNVLVSGEPGEASEKLAGEEPEPAESAEQDHLLGKNPEPPTAEREGKLPVKATSNGTTSAAEQNGKHEAISENLKGNKKEKDADGGKVNSNGAGGGKDVQAEEKEICLEVGGEEGEGQAERGVAKRSCDIRCIVIGLLVVVIMVGGASVAILAHRFKAEQSHELLFAPYFTDDMVLQRAPQRAVVWGYGPLPMDNTSVVVRLEGQGTRVEYSTVVKSTVAGLVWRVVLDEVFDKGPYTVTAELYTDATESKTEGAGFRQSEGAGSRQSEGMGARHSEGAGSRHSAVVLRGVLFGDVWVCAGQDNMQLSTDRMRGGEAELQSVDSSLPIRLLSLLPGKSDHPRYSLRGIQLPWALPSKESLAGTHVPEGQVSSHFSALCWLYGRRLQARLQYPIGLVAITHADTSIDDWTPSAVQDVCGRPGLQQHSASRVWNAMVHPMLDMSIFGLVWHQGEKDGLGGGSHNYNCSLVQLMHEWREEAYRRTLSSTDQHFPIGIVQLEPHRDVAHLTYGYTDVRWRQTANYGHLPNLLLRNTFLAVAIDLPDLNSTLGSMMPGYKGVLADRLVRGALAVGYRQKDVEFQGPLPIQYRVGGGVEGQGMQLVLHFNSSTPIDVRTDAGFEVCCSENPALQCPSSFIKVSYAPGRQWVDAPILSHTPSSLTLLACPPSDPPASGERPPAPPLHVVGVRYAWRETPCMLRACAVYGAETDLPMAPYIRLGLSADGLSHDLDLGQVNLM